MAKRKRAPIPLEPSPETRARVCAELSGKADGLPLELRAVSAFTLVSLVQTGMQLAPVLDPAVRTIADQFTAMVADYFVDCPTVRAVIDASNPPRSGDGGTAPERTR